MSFLHGLSDSPYRDAVAALCVAAFAFGWVKGIEYLACKGIISQYLSRKIIHITAGPIFVMSWPLFSGHGNARVIAAAVPFINLVRLFLAGAGISGDATLVKSVSRRGGREELLQGPLHYCIAIVAATLLFWRSSTAGIAAITLLCGGDGMADVIGRGWGGNGASGKLPYNSEKSVAGSVAMIVSGSAMFLGMLLLFGSAGIMPAQPLSALLPGVLVVGLAATLVESLPTSVNDNLTVPTVAALVSRLVLPGTS